jgi:hypothetical protein
MADATRSFVAEVASGEFPGVTYSYDWGAEDLTEESHSLTIADYPLVGLAFVRAAGLKPITASVNKRVARRLLASPVREASLVS